ncbi:MAG: 1-phosphofructokinase [Sporolactobacillus sp.]
MIYTCTMNPAIDLFCSFAKFNPFVVNRSQYEDYQANGKAINISLMLKKMGIDSIATGFLGGFTGSFIEETLQSQGVNTAFIKVDGITRINTFIRAGELEYKAVNHGPMIPTQAQEHLLEFIGTFKKNDTLFVSGSFPKNVDDSILITISRLAQRQGFSLILDVSSNVLLDCLPYHPALIKPSDEELAAFFNYSAGKMTTDQIIKAAHTLLERGAQRVIVSRGAKGAIYADQDVVLSVNAAHGKVVNTACSGDTFVACFSGALIQNKKISEALCFASAAASSTAFTAGLSDLHDVPDLLKQIVITEKIESEA